MKFIFTLTLTFQFLICTAQQNINFLSFKVKNIFDDSVNLADYAGKKLLVVNTASFCGYTHQFTKLQQLDSMYQSYNFKVIGFPCNDFGGQDPYADSTIFSFCQNQYGITFPMMSRISIKSGDTSAVYKWLQKKSLNGVSNAQVTWNFNKFLIDEQGNWVRHFLSQVEPNDTAITNWITSSVTAIKKSVNLNEIRIQNPASGGIKIFGENSQNSEIQFQLTDLMGRNVQSGKLLNFDSPIATGNKTGVYSLVVFTKDQSKSFLLYLN